MTTSDVLRYLPLVRAITSQLQKNLAPDVDLEKMVEWGQHGLMEALNDFQKRQGMTFQAFAFYRIRGSVYKGLRNTVWPSISSHSDYLFRDKTNQLLQWYGASSEGSVKRTLEAEVEELEQICQHLIVVSLLCRETALRLASSKTLNHNSGIAKNTRHALLFSLSILEERDLLFIQKYYFECHSMYEIASKLNLSISMAQRTHLRILSLLRESLGNAMDWKT